MTRFFIHIILFFAALLTATNTYCQIYGLPEVRTFDIEEYDQGGQNWSVAEDENGIIYFANNNGLLQYDGKKWSLYETRNKAVIRDLRFIDSKLYICGAGEIGYFYSNITGELIYESLIPKIPEEYQYPNEIWFILNDSSNIYFLASDFRYVLKRDTILYLENERSYMGYQFGDFPLLYNTYKGFFSLKDTTVFSIDFDLWNDHKGYFVPAYDRIEDSFYVYQKGFGIYSYKFNPEKEDKFSEFKLVYEFSEELIEKMSEISVVYFNVHGGNFYLSGLNGGFIEIDPDKDGCILHLDKKRGLGDNAIYSFYNDKQNGIWLATDNGISYVKNHSQVLYYDMRLGVDASGLDFIKFKNNYYLSNGQGVHILDNQSGLFPNKFKPVKGNRFVGWAFLNYKDHLLINSDNGLIEIVGDEYYEVAKHDRIYYVAEVESFEDWLFLSSSFGLDVLKISDPRKPKIKGLKKIKIEGVEGSAREVYREKDNRYWVTTNFNGVYMIEFGRTIEEYSVFHFTTKEGLYTLNENYLAKIDGIRVISGGAFLKPDLINDEFVLVHDSAFSYFNKKASEDISLLAVPLHNKNEIVFASDDEAGIAYRTEKGWLIDTARSMLCSEAQFYVEVDSAFFALTHKGMEQVFFDKKLIESNPSTIIRTIKLNRDSTIFYGNTFQRDTDDFKFHSSIDYKFNSLYFEYVCPSFEYNSKVKYSYFLKGYDNSWSDYTANNIKEYTNLKAGKYTFYVRAKNDKNRISTPASFTFEIVKAWYYTTLAYTIYSAIVILLVLLSIRLYNRSLRARNEKLEILVDERTREIRLQNEGIRRQNQEIREMNQQIKKQATSLKEINHQLELLSLVASETDNIVIIITSTGEILYHNKFYTDLLGDNRETKFVGQSLFDIEEFLKIQDLFDEVVELSRSAQTEIFIMNKWQKRFWLQLNITPVGNGNALKLVIVATNINRLKYAEEEISQQREELLVQSEQLEAMNSELEHVNQLTTDSINYAQRIQFAILPREEDYKEFINDGFVVYRPRDIVSGDFYWYGHVQNKAIFIEADCTGHGVPGAMMSAIGNAVLNEIVIGNEIVNPALILKELDREIKTILRQEATQTENQDGMDISVAVYNYEEMTISLSLANQFAYMLSGGKLVEIEGDIFAIGGGDMFANSVTYDLKRFKVNEGDTLYMFSDGYRDQFNAEGTQKLMVTRFKSYIQKVSTLEMDEQQELLIEYFDKWRGTSRQIDDVLIWGIKF